MAYTTDSSLTVPCRACGDAPTDRAFHDIPLCGSCKTALRSNNPDGELPSNDRIEMYCETYSNIFKRGGL